MGTLAHELKHAYQYQNHQTALSYAGGGGMLIADLMDEVEAYKRGQLFGQNTGVDITVDWVRRQGYDSPDFQMTTMTVIPNSNPMLTYGELIDRTLFNRGANLQQPTAIIYGWQRPYMDGVNSSGILERLNRLFQ